MKEISSRDYYQKRKKELDQKFNQKSSDVKLTVDDDKQASSTFSELNLKGSKELSDQIEKYRKKIENELENKINKLRSEFDGVKQESQQRENDAKEASQSSLEDSKELTEHSEKLHNKEARAKLNEASKIAEEDQQWLNSLKEAQVNNRKKYENMVNNELKRYRNRNKVFKKNKQNQFEFDKRKGAERIEKDDSGRRLKKYHGDEKNWAGHVKVQEFGQKHKDQQLNVDKIKKNIEDFFNNQNKK